MIGYFGDMIFEVNAERINTFNGLEISHKSRIASHDIIGQKSKNEFLGLSLSSLSFSIKLSAGLGVSPIREIEKWKEYVQTGKEDVLVIGGKPIAEEWVVTGVSESWDRVFSDGKLYSATIKIDMEEYNGRN
jgi:hypothetical protein